MNTFDASTANLHWMKRWSDHHTPWDLKGPHPDTSYLWQEWQRITQKNTRSLKVAIPGAGSAHDAQIFLQDHCSVWAYDLAREAQKKAMNSFQSFENFHYILGDMFSQKPKPKVHLIFDRAVLCAFGSKTTIRLRATLP